MNEDRSWTEIDLTNFENNLINLKAKLSAGTDFMQIVKADAYGHGANLIAQTAISQGAVMLGVANVQEGMLLRYQNIKAPILILSPSLESEIDLIVENDLIPTISDFQFALKFATKISEKIKIHINIDTGMGRSGIPYEQALSVIERIIELNRFDIDGIFSHFSAAEDDEDYTNWQRERFEKIISLLPVKPRYIHIANSSGALFIKSKITNLVRVGLLSYGIYASSSQKDLVALKAVMTFKAKIGQINKAKKGEYIGYNKTYQTQEDMDYAIIPVGYADGYDFLLSNRGKVLIKNNICPVIGRVSMDMIAVDISGIHCVPNDEVILLGPHHDQIQVEYIASLYGGSRYEILCQIGRRAKRYYIRNGETIDSSPLLRRDFVSTDYSNDKLNRIIETAIEQRLESKEISNLIYTNILRDFFIEHDRDIHYRKNFEHKIVFKKHHRSELKDYHLVQTTLTFRKRLQNDYFLVVCAANEQKLEKYFLQQDVEYRWLLDKNLRANLFDITAVSVNNVKLYSDMRIDDECLIIRCFHPTLVNLKNQEVDFSISTQTYYPKKLHQLSVFIIELTKGVSITFEYGDLLNNVEAINIFSGRSKFALTDRQEKSISVETKKNVWVFPTSGVIFVY